MVILFMIARTFHLQFDGKPRLSKGRLHGATHLCHWIRSYTIADKTVKQKAGKHSGRFSFAKSPGWGRILVRLGEQAQ
jgi:hypothetical protein